MPWLPPVGTHLPPPNVALVMVVLLAATVKHGEVAWITVPFDSLIVIPGLLMVKPPDTVMTSGGSTITVPGPDASISAWMSAALVPGATWMLPSGFCDAKAVQPTLVQNGLYVTLVPTLAPAPDPTGPGPSLRPSSSSWRWSGCRPIHHRARCIAARRAIRDARESIVADGHVRRARVALARFAEANAALAARDGAAADGHAGKRRGANAVIAVAARAAGLEADRSPARLKFGPTPLPLLVKVES